MVVGLSLDLISNIKFAFSNGLPIKIKVSDKPIEYFLFTSLLMNSLSHFYLSLL